MKAIYLCLLLVSAALTSTAVRADPFELATDIERSGDAVSVTAFGYTKLNLIRVDVEYTGDIALNGIYSIEGGMANIVMWAKVQGGYYFSRLPELQGAKSVHNGRFSIPFSSPENPITELVLNVELPNGGRLEIRDIGLSKN